jgi:hypothetical protein
MNMTTPKDRETFLADPCTNGIDTTYNRRVRNNNLMQHHPGFIAEQGFLHFIVSASVTL